MRELITMCILSLAVITGFNSCTKDSVKEAKSTAALKAGEASEKFMLKQFSKFPELQVMKCETEAEVIGDNVEREVAKFIKADSSQEGELKVAASVTGEVVKTLCGTVMRAVLPMVFEGKWGERYPCTMSALGGKISGLSDKVCGNLKL